MRRRELLSTSVIVIGGLSGCLNRIPLIGMNPEEVVTEFYEAQFAQDVETANSHIHRGSDIDEITPADAKRTQINEYRLISVTETDKRPEPEAHFPNETEVEIQLEILNEELEELNGTSKSVKQRIEHYNDGTVPQVETVSAMAEVEAILDFKQNGRTRRPTRVHQLIKDGDGWKIWEIRDKKSE